VSRGVQPREEAGVRQGRGQGAWADADPGGTEQGQGARGFGLLAVFGL